MPHRGKIVSWDDEKGFGFIETEANQRVFLHIKSFNHAKRRPRVGDRVKFQISTDAKGRPQANAVRHDGVRFGLPRVSLSAVFALLFLLGMGLATLFKYLVFSTQCRRLLSVRF